MKLLLSALFFLLVSFVVKPPSAYLTASETTVPVGTTVTFTGYNYTSSKQVMATVAWPGGGYSDWYAGYPDRNGTIVFTFPFSQPGEYEVLAYQTKGQKTFNVSSVTVSVY